MTNTTFRRRALLSSVAMLLVALVALGSATFAWFVANPTATASGLKMKTTADAGIAIASKSILDLVNDDDNVAAYKDSTVLRATGASVAAAVTDTTSFNLTPASPFVTPSSGELTFGTIAADAPSDEALDTAATWQTAGSGVYSEPIYLKTTTTDGTASATVNSVTVTITDTGSNAARLGVKVALVSSDDELIGIWKVDGGDNTKTWKGLDVGDVQFVGAAGLTDSAGTYKASGSKQTLTTPIVVGSTVNGTTGYSDKYIRVYVYLDGENAGVQSSNIPAATELISGITIQVSTAA